jgi:polyisoprenoid-binding protein YceI
MRRHFFAATAALAIATTSACALAFTQPSTKLDGVPSGVYKVDGSHTSVLFGISHLGFSSYHGRFNTVEGEVNFDPKAPEKSSVSITIPIASIDTNHEELEAKLKKEDWFDAAKFPTATFKSSKVEKLSETKGRITGDLTLRGVTKPLVLDVTFNGAGANPFAKANVLGFSATGSIKRSDFGLSNYMPAVGDAVSLTIELEVMQPQASPADKK